MAKAIGLIGTLSGKVGNTVYASVKGETIARVYNPFVSNPKTARQTYSRLKMVLAGMTARDCLRFIRAGWNGVAPSREFQQAVKTMIPVANEIIINDNVSGKPKVDYNRLYKAFSKDELGSITIASVDSDTAGSVVMTVNVPDGMYLDKGGNEVGVGLVSMLYVPDYDGFVVVDFTQTTKGQSTAVTLRYDETVMSGLNAYGYVFAKQIPNAANGINSTTLPWMYPAPTSLCETTGRVDLA